VIQILRRDRRLGRRRHQRRWATRRRQYAGCAGDFELRTGRPRSTYQAGQTLWRVRCCTSAGRIGTWAPDCRRELHPQKPPPYDSDPPIPDPACYLGCIVDVQNQALGENVSIVGTPYELNYHSDRVPGRRAAYRLNLTVPAARQLVLPPNTTVCLPNRHPECQPAAGNPIPVPATVTVRVAGKTYQTTNNLNAAIDWRFEWDGKDVYGRAPAGRTGCYADSLLQLPWHRIRHA